MDHQHASDLLAALVAGELDGSQARDVAAHVESCDECTGVHAMFMEVGDVGKSTDPSLFDAHPDAMLLARLAGPATDLTTAELRRAGPHVQACPTCAREVELTRDALRHSNRGWNRLVNALRPDARVWLPGPVPLTMAALLVVMALPATQGIRTLLRPGVEPGAVKTYVVDSQVRGEGATPLRIDRTRPVAVLLFDRGGISPPAGATHARLSLHDQEASRSVWEIDVVVADLFDPQDPILSLLVPTRSLRPGAYRLQLSWSSGEAPVVVAEFRVIP